ncbi:MAG: putative Bacterial pre-peptidase C-terminal domain protein [Massilia sp.]|nr:putative Bacterial pre-peptidase C-terminal domain protein [Massilia sp.]
MDKRSSRSLVAFARLLLLAACTLFTLPSSGQMTGQGPITYNYDEIGRLVGVTDAAGNSATYTYDAVGNILSIARHASTEVAIIDFTPNGGPAGAAVTISGGGFSAVAAQNDVKFNQVSATVVSSTATRIVTSVPAGASTGPISVTTANGSATSKAPFVVGAESMPTITQFLPSIGAAGSAVSITGTNFAASPDGNRISFDQRTTIPTSASATSVATVVPANASSGKITVTTLYGAAISANDFFVPPLPYSAAEIELTGRMAIGQTKTGAIAGAGKKGMVLFDGGAGQRISLSLSGVTIADGTVDILAPNGTLIGWASLSPSGRFIDTITLPATGTYTILIAPSASAKGSVTMTLNAVQNVTAAIAFGGAPVTVTTTVPGQDANLTFSATAGQRFIMNVTAISPSLGCPAFSVVRADGTNLVAPITNANCGTSFFLDTTTLPVAGSYNIVMNPTGANTGSATFLLRAVPVDVTAAITIGGPSVTLATTAPGQNANLSFSGTAGQRISLNITAVSPNLNCPTFSIVKPDGTFLMAPSSNCSTSMFFDTATLPLTGNYMIVLNPRDANINSATFTLYAVPPDASSAITLGGPAVTLGNTAPGQNVNLTFSGTVGQRISMNATAISSTLGCPSFSILKPDGTSLVATGTTCSSPVFIDATPLPVGGTYTIVMNPSGTGIGSATFTVYEVPPDIAATTVIGAAALTVTTTVPGQNAIVSFSGTAGQQVTVRVTGNSMACAAFSLRKPDGSALVSTITCGASLNLAQQVLPTTGTYAIKGDPTGANIGSANLAVTSP